MAGRLSIGIASEVTGFLSCMVVAAFTLCGEGAFTPGVFVAAMISPAFAVLAYGLLLLAAPQLTGRFGLRFPLNFTLPLVFCTVLWVVARLTSSAYRVIAPSEGIHGVLMWHGLAMFATLAGLHCLALSVLTQRKR